MSARKPLDVHGILERAGADVNAPEGSQAWSLAQVDAAFARIENVVSGYEALTGAGYRYIAADVRKALEGRS